MLKTVTRGIFQSDIILRTMLIAALDDIRKNPWQLDYIFASLPQDKLTRDLYGEAEIAEAKQWFLNTDIPVSMSFRFDNITTPLISISLEDSSEGATTLGDVHYVPTEDVATSELLITPAPILQFTPASYDPTTGTVVLPSSVTTANVFQGMIFFDTQANVGYAIQEVVDSQTFMIQIGVKANFTKAVVAPASSFYVVHLESLEEKEAYRIDLYVSGNSAQILYLYAIVKYIFLKHKQEYLEARGFERSSVSSNGVRLLKGQSDTEIIFTRTFTVSGYVRQYWPKAVYAKIDGISTQVSVSSDGAATPSGLLSVVEDQGWDMDADGIG